MTSVTAAPKPVELRRDSLGLPSALAVSVSFISPTIGALFVTALIVGQAGGSAPFVFGVGAIALALNASTFAQFAKRVPSSGVLYSSVARGLGPAVGLVMGLVLLVVYGIVAVANLDLFGGYVADVLRRRANLDVPWWVIVIGIVLVIAVLGWFSISASMRFDLVLLAFELTVVGVLVAVIIVRGGVAGQAPAAFGPSLSPTGFSGLGLGFVFVALAFFGFEACTTVAEEVQSTKRSVPIALIGSVIASGLFFVVASYAMIIGFGRTHVGALTSSASPVSDLAVRYLGGGYAVLIDLAAISAISAVLLSMQNANFRVWYALAREHIIPHRLARIHPRYRTPSTAILVFSGVALVFALIFGAVWGAMPAFGNLGYFAGLGILPIYLLPNIALVRFMWTKHRDEFSPVLHGVFPVLSSLVMITALIFTVHPLPAGPQRGMPFVLVGIAILAIVWVLFLRRRAPERIARVGEVVFVDTDEPGTQDPPSSIVIPDQNAKVTDPDSGRHRKLNN